MVFLDFVLHAARRWVAPALFLAATSTAAGADPPPVLDCSYYFCCNDYGTAITTSLDGTAYVGGHTSVSFSTWVLEFHDCEYSGGGGGIWTHPARVPPTGIALDDAGWAYISRSDSNTVTRLSDPPVVWGGTGSTLGQFVGLSGIAIEGPHLYAADRGNHRVQKLLLDGTPITSFGTHGNGPGELALPIAVTVDRAGHFYVTDYENHRVQKYSTDGVFVTEWGVHGSGPGELVRPNAISADGDGGVFVADSARIQKFSDSGALLMSWALPDTLSFSYWPYVSDLAADGQGAIYVVNGFELFKFREVDPTAVEGGRGSSAGLAFELVGPNPFRDRLGLSWTQPAAGSTDVSLMDVSGRRIATIASGTWPAGRHHATWSATGSGSNELPAGFYWLRVRSQGGEASRPVIHVR